MQLDTYCIKALDDAAQRSGGKRWVRLSAGASITARRNMLLWVEAAGACRLHEVWLSPRGQNYRNGSHFITMTAEQAAVWALLRTELNA